MKVLLAENAGFCFGVKLAVDSAIKTQNEYNNLKRHSINHFYEKLLKLKELMNTEEAKRIAKARHEFMQRYLEEFFEKWKVKK